MTARSGPYTGTVAITVGAGPCTAATAGSIVPGETRTGLGQIGGCVLRSDGLVIGWELGIDARTRVRLHATTSLWPGLIVTSADLDAEWSAFLARSRYGDEHSALAVLDLDPGDYIIWLKQGSEEPEAYTLSVDALEIVPCIPVGSVAPLQVVTGTLTTAGCRPDFRLEYIAEPWTIILFRDRTVGIKLTSTTFDARLFIMSPFGSVGGEHANDALVLVTPALGGPFTLWVTSRDESSAGPYELAVYGSEPCTATVTGRVALGDHRAGTLVYTDCTLGDSELVAGWALDLDAAAHVRVRAGSVDFDPYVAITDGDLNRVQLSWDWPDDEIVVYTVEPLPAGRHIIWVGSHDHKTGSYEFDVQAADPR